VRRDTTWRLGEDETRAGRRRGIWDIRGRPSSRSQLPKPWLASRFIRGHCHMPRLLFARAAGEAGTGTAGQSKRWVSLPHFGARGRSSSSKSCTRRHTTEPIWIISVDFFCSTNHTVNHHGVVCHRSPHACKLITDRVPDSQPQNSASCRRAWRRSR
jgi:hypothetical protein